MKRVMLVYGTRPEAIKMAPVVRALVAAPHVEPVVVVTGQHRTMLDQVNDLFGIRPDRDLDILTPGQTLEEITNRALAGVGQALAEDRPDAVIVQGDTTTTFASALASFYARIPLIHLEAGLRTGDISSPFPEEMNRRLTTQLAALHLAPTATSAANLLREGVERERIFITGNSVIDALLSVAARSRSYEDPALRSLDDDPRRVLLLTTHRRESWGAPMARAAEAVASLAAAHADMLVVAPLHRNPTVRRAVVPALEGLSNVLIVEPATYADFVRLMSRAEVILSDSGGVQEEAPSLGKPVLVLRDNTERPEAVEAGTVRLVGTDSTRIRSELERLWTDPTAYAEMARAINPYGDGSAAERTVQAVRHLLADAPGPREFAPLTSGSERPSMLLPQPLAS